MSSLDLDNGVVEQAHGSGGRAMSQLIEQLFIPAFDNPCLRQASDQASFAVPSMQPGEKLVMATDSHVITPLFFPGGDIGSLSVNGTVNDVVMSGANALYLSAAFILEEGFPLGQLKQIVDSMARAAADAGISIVTGDTKVVERGKADGIYITTTGIGRVEPGLDWQPRRIKPGDKVILSGYAGDHGISILAQREHIQLSSELTSDTQSLGSLVAQMRRYANEIHCLRDPTRGGVAACLNELADQAGAGISLNEAAIPVRKEVCAICEILGLDPLDLANEGKLIAICSAEVAEDLVYAMRQHRLGEQAAIIGEVIEDDNRFVRMKTLLGGYRLVDWRYSGPLPRIC